MDGRRPGEGRGGAGLPGLRAGPLAGLVCGAALGASVFLLANLVHDRMAGGRTPANPPAGFSLGADARAPARVLSSLPGDGVRAVLLPLREDGGSTDAEERVLDEALFPGQAPRRYARLLVANPRGAAPYPLDLGPGAVVLETAAGPAPNEDLAAAVEARLASLSGHRLLDLQVAHAAERSVAVPGGEFVRVLVAFPGGADPRAATGATLAGGTRLLPREVAIEGLRTALLDGRIDALKDADRAEARSPPGGRR